MNKYKSKIRVAMLFSRITTIHKLIPSLCLIFITTSTTMADSQDLRGNNLNRYAKHHHNKKIVSVLRIRGQAITGSNRLFSQPIWDLGESLGSSGFNFIFAHNPGQAEPLAITESTPMNAVLASGLDNNYLALFGLTADSIDPSLVNVPIHKIPVLSGPAGQIFQLPAALDVGATIRSRVATNKPVTLKKWLSAKAIAVFKCYANETSSVVIKFKSLIPDSIYSAWGVYSFDTDGDGLGDQIGGVPLGGVPNILVADKNGSAKMSRKLNFCPKEEPRLKYLTVAYHSDTNNNGAVPDQALLGMPGGTVAHAAISFPINVVACAQYPSQCL